MNITDNSNNNKKKSFKINFLISIIITTLLSSSIVGGVLYYSFSKKLDKVTQTTDANTYLSQNNNSESSKGNMSIPQIAQKVGPSIVGIKITTSNNTGNFFDPFGNQNNAQSVTEEGSGIVIRKDGYIMTNYHVVENADPKNPVVDKTVMEVYLPNKKSVKAKFIGGDSYTDLAVIKIDSDNLKVAQLGDSSKLIVGDSVVAIGNPLGLEFAGSVTTGVVSALNRKVQTENSTQKLIQTDAAINPGNSGGALLNSNGEVIGINSIKISQTGVEGLGFAIPINEAKPIVDELIKNGKIKRLMIGITAQEISDTISKAYNMPVGIYVTGVSKGSSAQNAGIKKGDIIVKIAGKKVTTMQDVNDIKNKYKVGDSVKIKIVRESKKITLTLKFQEES